MSSHIQRLTGVHPNVKCVQCGITAAESYKKGPVQTGINHPEYKETYSFYESIKDHKLRCPRCHKENEIKSLFEVMDNFEKKHGKKKLKERLGI